MYPMPLVGGLFVPVIRLPPGKIGLVGSGAVKKPPPKMFFGCNAEAMFDVVELVEFGVLGTEKKGLASAVPALMSDAATASPAIPATFATVFELSDASARCLPAIGGVPFRSVDAADIVQHRRSD
jgi:hypothetical protein